MKLKALLGAFAAASVAALALGAVSAHAADNYLIQLDDRSSNDTVVGNTYKNGALIQSVTFPDDTINSPYGLWSGATLNASFDNQFNFYEPGSTSVLSDTSEISGNQGDNFITFNFLSDQEHGRPLIALPNGLNFVENGKFQDIVFPGVVSNGDFYTIQMASDVPEPAAWALMLLGVGAVGFGLRMGRRSTALSVA